MKIVGVLNKKTVISAACVLLLVCLLLVSFLCCAAEDKNADTESKRMSFFENLGITAPRYEGKKTITVPQKFSPVYENYNALQKAAGYDLNIYKGVSAELYTYTVSDKSGVRFYADIIVYNGRVIGGDFCSAALDGKMVPLKTEEIKRCLK